MFAEGRHRAALDMSLDALQFYCSSAFKSNADSLWHHAQYTPAAYFSIALQSAIQLRDWSRLSQIVKLPHILDFILTTDVSSYHPNDIPLTASQYRLQSQDAVLSLIQIMSHLMSTSSAQSAFSIPAALPSNHQTILVDVRLLLNKAAGSISDSELDVSALGKAIFAHQSWDLQDQVSAVPIYCPLYYDCIVVILSVFEFVFDFSPYYVVVYRLWTLPTDRVFATIPLKISITMQVYPPLTFATLDNCTPKHFSRFSNPHCLKLSLPVKNSLSPLSPLFVLLRRFASARTR
jgi:hypothetical protein